MIMKALSDLEIKELLQAHPHWRLEVGGKAMVCDLVFSDFKSAFAFMTEIALMAESLNHHPEWSNVYNRLSIRMTTHDAGGLTVLDQKMIGFIDARMGIRAGL